MSDNTAGLIVGFTMMFALFVVPSLTISIAYLIRVWRER